MNKFDLETLPLQIPKLLRIKIFADGADKAAMVARVGDSWLSGFTTNPTLMKKSGITDYEKFARDVLTVIKDKPISFEVFSDELDEMAEQARTIASWGSNVFVKIPITNTRGQSTSTIVQQLSAEGVSLNITAITTLEQVQTVAPLLSPKASAIVSVFAGRIADSGREPVPIMKKCVAYLADYPHVELLWASPRELLNLVQAEEIGCHIITMTEDLLKKMPLLGGDLNQVSLDTVKMFFNDAQAVGYKINKVETVSS
jgi:transaldolase